MERHVWIVTVRLMDLFSRYEKNKNKIGLNTAGEIQLNGSVLIQKYHS